MAPTRRTNRPRPWATPLGAAALYLAAGLGWAALTGAAAGAAAFVVASAALVFALVARAAWAAGASAEELRALADCTPDVVFVKDRDGRYRFVNPAAERVFGRPAADILGRTDADVFGPEVGARRAELDRRVMASGLPETYEETNHTPDGPRTFLKTKAPRIDPDGAVTGVVGISHDLTARKRLEDQFRQSQKMDALGRLAGGVAHDFNNLLTVILGQTNMALDRADGDPALGEMLREVRDAGDRAAELVKQLLTFVRPVAAAPPRVIDPNAVVRGAERILRRLLGEDVRLATDRSMDVPPILSDRGQLEQVLVNLAVNARDAMPRGGTLTIRTRAAGGAAVIDVIDTGTGMTADVLARVFEPFFTTKGPGKGTGLGLAVVHGIVTKGGGRVEVASEPGRGTTFTLTFPASAAYPTPSPDGTVEDLPTPWGTETVLVVEDEPTVLWLARRLLRATGYTVLAAANAAEAAKLLAAHAGPLDLVLTDVVLPGESGPDLARRLAAERPGLRVLYMSGHADDAVARTGLADRAAVLEKPFSPDELLGRVRALLDERA